MEGLPRSFVSLADNGGEVTFWVDTSIVENGESPIVAHVYGKYIRVSESFHDFVELLTHLEDLHKLFS